ncbi:MAG: molybdopterin-dependent oxidoreductase [Hyphomicrobiales bacterium]|jgi:CO/xanthine dehydrogenase Mo-binding subunit
MNDMTNTFEFRKEFFADERDENLNEIGKRVRRQDIEGHVTGRSPFYDDNLFDGLLHMRYVRSPHHHARIRRIDTSKAQGMPGVVRIVTGADVPTNLNTLLALLDFGLDDEPVLSDKKVAYVGEPVAAVIAHTEAEARAAVKAVQVDWEVLPHVLDVEEALKPGAPTVCDVYPGNAFIYHGKYNHQKLRFGDVDAALKTADHVVESRHQMSPIEQAPIETCGAISAPEQNGRYVCYTGTQALFFSLGTASKVLNMPSSRLHFIGGTVGGGFGGKVDSIHEPLSILGTMLTGKPCKSQWDREEEMQVGAPRGAERWYITDGVMNDGRIVARKFRGYFDCGAYTRLSSYAVIKSVGHLPGPYTIPNVYADVYCVYTNRTPATAMRGFGITGVDFSIESHMDLVAEKVGMHPIDLRILNSYRDGDMKAHRRVAKNCAFIECCQVVAEKAGITIKPESKAASSLRDGGGARAQLPGFTATDQNGSVQGFESTSYARKGGGNATTGIVPSRITQTPTPPVSQPASYQPAPASAPPTAPAAPPAPATPPSNAAPTRKRSTTRFSSISGFRRR